VPCAEGQRRSFLLSTELFESGLGLRGFRRHRVDGHHLRRAVREVVVGGIGGIEAEAVGRRVTRIIPEFTPQPPGTPTMVFAIGEPGAALCVVCGADGVATLPLDSAGLALAGNLPVDTSALAEPAVAELAESVLGYRVPIVKPAERWLRASESQWDLSAC